MTFTRAPPGNGPVVRTSILKRLDHQRRMAIIRSKLIERAENARTESKLLDFKREFDTSSSAHWCEIVKDIVAFANSGGGVLLFGVNNDASNAEIDTAPIAKLDVADITNKIESYTGYQFGDIEILEVKREDRLRAAFIIGHVDPPMIFTRPGVDVVVKGKQRPAFARGTVYFRHGAKSEPGTRDDFLDWREKFIESARQTWMKGIRKVIEAPAGHSVTVISSQPSLGRESSGSEGMSIRANVSAAPGAVKVVPQNAEEIWPYRQKDLLLGINKQLATTPMINGHDILCINSHLNVLKTHPEFAYKPHRLASPQYSDGYAQWIVEQYKSDPRFFHRMREEYRKSH
jgi:hypothetical protein